MITILLQKILDLLKDKLSGLPKFNVTSPQDGEALVYDAESQKWINQDVIPELIDLSNSISIKDILKETNLDVTAYQNGKFVIVNLNYATMNNTPEDTTVIISGLPKAKTITTAIFFNITNNNFGRVKVNTDGELTFWYWRPYINNDITGQIIYAIDESEA